MKPVDSHSEDRRIQRTRKLLRDALISLIHEKRYDAIVVRDILERANVGRSTFYSHFRSKDELLVSGMHEMLNAVQAMKPPASAPAQEKIICFSLPVFEYIEQHRRAGMETLGSRGRAVIHDHLEKFLTERVTSEIRRNFKEHRKAKGIAPELLGQHIASTFVLTLNWWLESGQRMTVADINETFRQLALPALAAATG